MRFLHFVYIGHEFIILVPSATRLKMPLTLPKETEARSGDENA